VCVFISVTRTAGPGYLAEHPAGKSAAGGPVWHIRLRQAGFRDGASIHVGTPQWKGIPVKCGRELCRALAVPAGKGRVMAHGALFPLAARGFWGVAVADRAGLPARPARLGGARRPGRGQGARARVAARAMAAAVAAGSVRVMTRAPVMGLEGVSGVSQRMPQPVAARRVMRFCPSAGSVFL
jgi:hypothetical protein